MTIGRIGFAYNPTNEAATDLRERAEGWCRMHRIEHWAAQAQDFDALCADLPTTDVLVVLGGEGTFLRAARAVIDVDVPLLGVNLGKVGFLSKVEANELEGVLARLVAGEYAIDERMAVEARILPAGRAAGGTIHHALNDIVVARGALARV
jgi:NAD+ kinase